MDIKIQLIGNDNLILLNKEINDDDEDHDLLDLSSKSISSLDELADSQRIKKKEDDGLKLVETVFDNKTRLILFKMMNSGLFNVLQGAISAGKEANVYFALTKTESIAIKIFRIDAPSFKKMRPYVEGDFRFKRFKSSRSGFIEVWAKKEFKKSEKNGRTWNSCAKSNKSRKKYFINGILR